MNGNITHDWKNLLFELTKKEISVRYKKTFFGFLWMFLNPLSQMLILGFVFQNFTNISIKTENYFLFLFTGLIVWNFFSNTLSSAIPIYVNERALLQKSKFPREIILFSIVLSNLFHFSVSLFVLFIFMLCYFLIKLEFNQITSMFFKTPLVLITTFWIGLFVSGLGLLLSSLNVRFRDISFFMSAGLPLLFYATPIIWELHFVPRSYLPILFLNPLVAIIETNRLVFLNSPLLFSQGTIISILSTTLIITAGLYVFRRESPYFDDWL